LRDALVLILVAVIPSTCALANESMTVDQRVACRLEIEQDRHDRRDWPETSTYAKPTLNDVLPADVTRSLVEDDLRKENALRDLYGLNIDSMMVQAELERIAGNSKEPERLSHLYTLLGSDPLYIAECLVRPLLSDRWLRKFFETDNSIHSDARRALARALEHPEAQEVPVGVDAFTRRYVHETRKELATHDRDIVLDEAA
jgi:hypothetical protein